MKKILRTCLCLIFLSVFESETIWAGVLIVANKDVPVQILTKEEVKKIFLGKMMKWPDDTNITFVTLDKDPTHYEFLKEYVKRTEDQYNRYWKKMMFTGKGLMPRKFSTEKALVQFVSKTKGAIGYIGNESKNDGVKVLDIK